MDVVCALPSGFHGQVALLPGQNISTIPSFKDARNLISKLSKYQSPNIETVKLEASVKHAKVLYQVSFIRIKCPLFRVSIVRSSAVVCVSCYVMNGGMGIMAVSIRW